MPGLGIVALILLIFVTGLFAANFIGRHVVRQWEGLLNRVPVVRGIYSTIKSMMDILSFAERESYRRVVLIQFPKNGHYCFAFVTGVTKGEMQQLSPDPLVHVYVPTSPNPTSGYFLLVPEREVIAVDITVEEAMKLIVSGDSTRRLLHRAARRRPAGRRGRLLSNQTQVCRSVDRACTRRTSRRFLMVTTQ